MTWLLGICSLWLLPVMALAQKHFEVSLQNSVNVMPKQSYHRTGVKTDCLDGFMRLTRKLSTKLNVPSSSDGSQFEPLTPNLASKCGFSIDSDHWGNYKVFASLLNCFAGNMDDTDFRIDLRVRMRGVNKAEQDAFQVGETCTYDQWAPREILCDRNFMEVSVNRLPGEIKAFKPRSAKAQTFDQWSDSVSEAITSKYDIWRMVFFTPKQKAILLDDALKAGYAITTTSSRLVLRSGFDMPETYAENVTGVPMKIIKVTTYFKKQWSVTMLDTVAACPTGGLSFTEEMITWYYPQISPVMSSTDVTYLAMHMGIDGKKIDSAHMEARGYNLTTVEDQIVMTIPVGGPDGYYKSQAVNNLYYIIYVIEPMLELLWSEGGMDATRQRILFPIKTPLAPRPPQFVDLTDVEQRMFIVVLGTFLQDVELVNLTFSSGVLTVDEAIARGFNVQEQLFQNGSKAFRFQVPFSDPFVVRKQVDLRYTIYAITIIYGFMIQPESTPFSYVANLKVNLQDVVLPTLDGSCDDEKFYITISNGNLVDNYNIMLGQEDLTPSQIAEYGIKENTTHTVLAVPFLSSEIAFELMYPTSLRARVDVLVWDPVNKWSLSDFSLACNFPMTMTECFSNGSISALAVKVDAVPELVPHHLTLRDPSCTPIFSDDRFAYFSFDANSCGTIRRFYDGIMIYHNEITLPNWRPNHQEPKSEPFDSEYRVTISCFYTINDTQMITFSTKPRESDPMVEVGYGELQVILRLAFDGSYTGFYLEGDYPVVQFLARPLFFEVTLLQATDPQIELVLENCWATQQKNRSSTPKWDLVVNGCWNPADTHLTVFHPVLPGSVPFPSHVKRFEIQMFTFTQNNIASQDQLFVHCDAVLCDVNQIDAICNRQCPSSAPVHTAKKGQRDAETNRLQRTRLSSGKILLSSS
ncbi:hypothetical protein DNTS_004526 [Danionella cerebrum]|uniref:ZP domain-containing protein n=1 Tax=Danionella cerebrum TaxID=2873325 RepID=A0A553RE89_9TELE|nr:hypothetical protein DNTS_004526 [Danionella translucida]